MLGQNSCFILLFLFVHVIKYVHIEKRSETPINYDKTYLSTINSVNGICDSLNSSKLLQTV